MPDEIYNLGAQSHVRVSFDIPEYTGDVTGLGTVRLLEAMRETGLAASCASTRPAPRRCSASVAARRRARRTPFHPRSPYACAKVYAYWITVNYREAYGMFAVQRHPLQPRVAARAARPSSPARSPAPWPASSTGFRSELFLGNLDAKRDWGFAGDYVEAMWLMLQQDEPDDYVIATGETHTVREFVRGGLSRVPASIAATT